MANGVAETRLSKLEEMVTRFFHMMNSHCPGNVAPLMTGDVELVADETPTGQEAVNAYLVRLWEAYPQLTFRVENLIVAENGVAAEVTYAHGPGGDGARCLVFHFRGDLIRRVKCY